MDHSLFAEGVSAGALLAVVFGPLAFAYRREIRAWWRAVRRDVFGPLP